jgi:protein-S-isoprenylcysteine O-methyltransferase Ste14
MNTALLLFCFLGLQAAFIWARYTVFRIDGPTPPGARLVEVSTVLCIGVGMGLIASRSVVQAVLDVASLAVVCASALMFSWAVRSVRRWQLSAAFSIDMPAELLRGGAFGFVRNPFYLAYLLAHAVPLVGARSVWALLPMAWMAMLYRRAVAVEERKFLNSALAVEWQQYAREIGRFLPKLPLRGKQKESLI